MSEPVAGKTSRESRAGAERAFLFTAAALLLWLIFWIVSSWPYSLDDALIHLRYADHLLHEHRISYDGVHPSFGTSSLLYVWLLAGLRSLTTSPVLPRVVTSVVYVVLYLLLANALLRVLRRQRQSHAVWLMACALLAVVVAPSAVRWLDDGMETGLVFLDAVFGVLLLRRAIRPSRNAVWPVAVGFLYGVVTVLLRVELLILTGCVSLMAALALLAKGRSSTDGQAPYAWLWRAGAPLLGGLAGAALIFATMHSLLPDTALAKAFGAGAWRATLEMTAVTVVSSFSFGIGLLCLWLLSLIGLSVWDRVRLADGAGNLLFPLVLLLSAVRGQAIQGIRYLGWTLLFPLLWNLLRVAEVRPKASPQFLRLAQGALVVFLLALVPAFSWESHAFSRLFAGRVATLNAFRAEPQLASLRGHLGIAEDVGFVGYFTQGNLCDPYGLVNGRAAARLTYEERFMHCMAMHPVFAFGSREFLQKVTFQRSLAGWSVCHSYDFDNVRTRDVHYLVVAPDEVPQVCAASARAVEKVLPGLVQPTDH